MNFCIITNSSHFLRYLAILPISTFSPFLLNSARLVELYGAVKLMPSISRSASGPDSTLTRTPVGVRGAWGDLDKKTPRLRADSYTPRQERASTHGHVLFYSERKRRPSAAKEMKLAREQHGAVRCDADLFRLGLRRSGRSLLVVLGDIRDFPQVRCERFLLDLLGVRVRVLDDVYSLVVFVLSIRQKPGGGKGQNQDLPRWR